MSLLSGRQGGVWKPNGKQSSGGGKARAHRCMPAKWPAPTTAMIRGRPAPCPLPGAGAWPTTRAMSKMDCARYSSRSWMSTW